MAKPSKRPAKKTVRRAKKAVSQPRPRFRRGTIDFDASFDEPRATPADLHVR